MNPLETLTAWLTSLPDRQRERVITLASHFHPDASIARERKGDTQEAQFMKYIDSTDLNYKEIAFRSLIVPKLIEFAFSHERTEQDWTEHLDRLLDFKNLAIKDGMDDMYDDDLATFPERKEQGVKAYQEWTVMMDHELNERAIADWYFDPSRWPALPTTR